MTNAQDNNNGEWFDRNTGEIADAAMVPVEIETVMVREDTAPILMDPKDLPNLDDMEPGFSLAQQYVRFNTPGQSARGILLGFNEFKSTNGEGKRIAIFQNAQGVWANAGDNLMSQIEHLPKGTPLQVTYKGDVKTGRGFTVKTFEVRILNPKPVVPEPEIKMDLKPGGVDVPSKRKQQPA